MERNFTLPITIAAALHAGLLFGIRPPHVIGTDNPARPVSLRPIVPTVEVFVDPPKSETAPEKQESAKGVSEQERPTLLPPPPEEHPTGYLLNIPPTKPNTLSTDPKFDLSPPGRIDGNPDLIGIAEKLIGVSQLDNPPRTRLQGAPAYPFEAKTRGLTGTVTVEFTVDENGLVRDPFVANSTDRVFDEATLRAVAKWRFEPGKRAGRIVRFRMAVPVIFNLNDN